MTDPQPIEIVRVAPAPVPPQARQVMVRMRDGVHLASDVYLPADDDSPGPTVLIRLPYDKNGEYTSIPAVADYFTAHGYRVVAQDVRGKFRSQGQTLLFVHEPADGYDTIEWITQQEWSDGIVGMWGDSYYGYTQWAAVSTAHPALRAISPRVTGTRLGSLPEEIPGTGTCEIEMGVQRMYPLTMFHGNDMLLWEMDWTSRPYHDTVERFFAQVGSRSDSYDVWHPNPVTLQRFPDGSPFDAPAIPVLMTVGWWDNCAPWQWQDHEELRRRPAWALNEYLLIESIDHENNAHHEQPWTRGGPPSPEQFAASLDRYLGPSVEFFDVFLRGRGTPDDIPRVRWQLAGDGPAHRVSPSWPPAEVTRLTLYPTDAEAALGNAPGGRLESTAVQQVQTVSWKHDPTDPVPSPMPDAFAFLAFNPDEREAANRPDVLVFTTQAYQVSLDLVGPVDLELAVRSDGFETDVFARLLDVAPDGAAHLVARGQRTVLPVAYGSVVTVPLGQVGYRVHPGHSLRLVVASTDAPEFIPSFGQTGNRWTHETAVSTVQTTTLGGPEGMRLHVSVLPAGQ